MKFPITLLFAVSFSLNTYSQLWKQYADSAYGFYDQRNMEKARVYGDTAKELLKVDSFWTNTYARVCNDLANLYRYLNKHEKAESMFLEAKEIREKILGKEDPAYVETCEDLAFLYANMGLYDKAEPLYIEGISISEKALLKDPLVYAGSCTGLGLLYMNMDKYEKSESLLVEAKNIREKELGKDDIVYASSCFNLSLLYWSMGQYKKAESLSIEAKLLRQKIFGKEDPDFAQSCYSLAGIYHETGKYEKAELLLIEAIQIWEKLFGKEHGDYASGCDALASLYTDMGQYEKAEPLYLEAKSIRQKAYGKENDIYGGSCDNLAGLYTCIGQYEKAEPLFLEAIKISEKVLGKESSSYALGCANLASLYMDMGNYKKAEPLYIEARQIYEKVLGKEHPLYATSCDGLADLYKNIGQFAKTEMLYLEAIQFTEKILGNEHPKFSESCIKLGTLYRILNKPGKANDFYVKAIHTQNIQIKKIFQFTSEVEQQFYLKKIADNEKIIFSFCASEHHHSNNGFTYNISLSSRNLILSSSQKLKNTIYNSSDTSIKNKYNSWISSREQISFWNAKPIADRPAYVKILEEQANTLEKELTRLSSDFKNEQQKEEVNWKSVQQSLKINEAAIEFVEFNYYTGKRWTDSTYYIALVLRKDKPEPVLVRLFEKKQLDILQSSKEDMATDDKINTLYKGNKSLNNLIWKPLEKYLNGISKIYFASAGNLFKISFAALPVNDKQVLGDKYQLIQLNTTASVTDNTQNFITTTDKIQLYGGIRYDADSTTLKQAVASYQLKTENSRSFHADLERGAGFQYLPGTQKETEAIKKEIGNTSIPVTILSGTNATEESVKALTGKKSPSVLHIATHGFFFPDPKDDKRDSIQRKFETSGKAFKQSDNPLFRSGLLFAGANNAWHGKPIDGIEDGILTAYEVSNLYLPNTKLVVLSACETALGDIQGSEGVYGLQRAFKLAGVQNLVMSLWKVPDAETAEFMQLFYKNLFAKQTISNAFYNAQKTMKNKYRSEPYKWAAWVLIR